MKLPTAAGPAASLASRARPARTGLAAPKAAGGKKAGLPSFDDALALAHAASAHAAAAQAVHPVALPQQHRAHDEAARSVLPPAAPSKHGKAAAAQPQAAPADARAPAGPGSFQAQLSQATAPTGAAEPAAVAVARPPTGLLELSLADPSLRVTGGTEVMHINLQTAANGPLELEVRVHHGRTDVRIDGAGPLFAERAPELERVLASEGLSLGTYTTGHEHQAPDRDAPDFDHATLEGQAPPPATPAAVTNPTPPGRHEGRIDVQA